MFRRHHGLLDKIKNRIPDHVGVTAVEVHALEQGDQLAACPSGRSDYLYTGEVVEDSTRKGCVRVRTNKKVYTERMKTVWIVANH